MEQNMVQEGKQNSSRLIKLTLALMVLLLFLGAIIAGFFSERTNTPKQEAVQTVLATPTPASPAGSLERARQWVNCDNVQDVTENSSGVYAACLGGVLVVDTQSGDVIDQISMTDGLGNSIATSLAKYGDSLFIGTQDGFTRFNLRTRQAKKISVDEGLVNGSNIELALDGDKLWVGTFDGISRYNIPTGKLNNYTDELGINGRKYSIAEIISTPNAVYATIVANEYSSGGIVRWNKEAKKWESFNTEAFGKDDRVDMFDIVSVDGRIFVSDNTDVWLGEDKEGTSWERLDGLVEKLKEFNNKNYISVRLVGEREGKLIVLAESILYQYDPGTGEVKQIYPDPINAHAKNVLYQTEKVVVRDGKIWLKPYQRKEGEQPWLGWLSLSDFSTGAVNVKKRPLGVERVLAVIDSEPLVTSSDGWIWRYSPTTNQFRQLLETTEGGMGTGSFEPIADSQKVFVFGQPSGMGCGKPVFAVFDYLEGTIRSIEMNGEVAEKIVDENMGRSFYSCISLAWRLNAGGKFAFRISRYNDEESYYALLDALNESWELVKELPEGGYIPPEDSTAACNREYTFAANGNKFNMVECRAGEEKTKAAWNAAVGRQNLPAAPAEYSPFDDWDTNQKILEIIFAHDYLWAATNRGLLRYKPASQKWELFDTKRGLVSNEIPAEGLVVTGGTVWVATHWGGLSGISY